MNSSPNGDRNRRLTVHSDSNEGADEPQFAPELSPDFADDHSTLELDDDCFEALTPDDDYEPLPEPGDFWTNQDAA